MQRSKALKLTGFAGALCASAALVGFSVSGTGAYFTDSHSGSINAGTGTVKVSTNNLSLNFDNLLPGEYQKKDITYTAHTTSTEDIWLVFPTDGSAAAFTSTPKPGPVPLGRYGHFAVTSTNGAHFTSYNLARSTGGVHASDACSIDNNGEGGSNQQPTSPSDTQVPYCAPADAILLASGLSDGQGGTATLEFGFTPLLTDPQGQATAPLVAFKIVATQHGVRPDNQYNGTD